MAAEKVYANGVFIKTQSTSFGDITKLSINVQDFTDFLLQHNNNGWVNIDLLERREPSDKGYTHYAILNEWKPKEGVSNNQPAGVEGDEDQELPF